jgi:glutaredoxin
MIVYSTKKCQACKSLKAQLKEKGIRFRDVFIEDLDPSEQVKLKITSVPTIEVEGKRYGSLKEFLNE